MKKGEDIHFPPYICPMIHNVEADKVIDRVMKLFTTRTEQDRRKNTLIL